VLTVLHYVWGGLSIAFSSIFIIHIVLGVLIVNGKMGFPQSPEPNQPSPLLFGFLFIAMGSCAVIFGWALGIVTIISGRKMAARKSRIFSIVVGGVNCISFPLGTALGVFTIIVLSRSSVKMLYESQFTG
jgi:hypothetical protein